MSAILKRDTEIPKWRIEIAAMVAAGERFPEGKIMESIKEFATRHEQNWMTVRTAYYQYQNKIPAVILDILTDPKREELRGVKQDSSDPGDTVPEDPQPEAQEPKQEQPDPKPETAQPEAAATAPAAATEPKPTKQHFSTQKNDPDYPAGKIVEFKVVDIMNHGAKLETTDGNRMEGFLYIGNLTNKFVSDINKYLKFGDVIRAQVLHVDEMNARINVSTKNLPLKEHGVVDPAAGYKKMDPNVDPNDIHQRQQIEELKRQVEAANARAAKAEETAKAAKEAPALPAILGSEMNEISQFVKGIIGWDPSEKALEAFAKLFTAHGMFKTTLALGQIAQGFEVDLGLLLAQQVDKKLGRATFPE